MTNVLWPLLGRQKPFFKCALPPPSQSREKVAAQPHLTGSTHSQILTAGAGCGCWRKTLETLTLWQIFQSISATLPIAVFFRELQTEVKHDPIKEINFTGSLFSSFHRFNDAISTSIQFCFSGCKFGKALMREYIYVVELFLKRAVFAYGFR